MNAAFQIKRLEKQDIQIFLGLIKLFREVFETETQLKAGETYLAGLLETPGFIVYAAISGNEVMGGLTAYELASYYSENAEIFIFDVAVKPKFQRKGFGKQLIAALKKHCEKSGIKIMFVEANEEDEHALDFYHSTGAHPEKVIQFNYFLDKENDNG